MSRLLESIEASAAGAGRLSPPDSLWRVKRSPSRVCISRRAPPTTTGSLVSWGDHQAG
jgi:hypothetical protein